MAGESWRMSVSPVVWMRSRNPMSAILEIEIGSLNNGSLSKSRCFPGRILIATNIVNICSLFFERKM